MLFPLFASRLFARNVLARSKHAFRRVPTLQVTRSFTVSRVAFARTATVKAKPAAEKTTAKKRPTSKAARKPAAKKKKTKKAAPKLKKPDKKAPIKILPVHKPPKFPPGSYALFYQRTRLGVQRQEGEHPLQISQRVMKEASVSWKALSEQEKQPFRDEYAAAFAEYSKKREEFLKNTDVSILKEISRRRVARGKPRLKFKTRSSTRNGFIVFLTEQRAKGQAQNFAEHAELTRETARRWNALSDEEKASYSEKARIANAVRNA